ncbi:MAG: saccharopine dehydrogenase NADP-binding domain-containing protein [Maritimibacter sp.]
MNILLLGGTGVFGSRLARLLLRDGHAVTLAGRNLAAAQKLAQELGCDAVQMDRNGDLQALADHQVVVDAAGPFHGYGENPYRLARAAIAAGVHYLDLSDNAAFCAGISALDAEARAAGVCVISGLSSVPALSSAAVRALAGGDTPDEIDTAILPGNRSPRGLSVMASILSQAGRPMQIWRDGAWVRATGWSDPQNYRLPGGITRQGWLIEVPDLVLFPDHFGANTVLFRAGLELAVMRYGLWAFASLRRWIPIPINRPVLLAFKFSADLLAPFGSGRGGMSVAVTVGQEKRFWRLLVEDGDGPFIPTIAARALLRRSVLPIGARPALEAITLEEAEAAMEDLNARSERSSETLG